MSVWSALRFRSQYLLIPFDQEGTGESESEGNGESGEQGYVSVCIRIYVNAPIVPQNFDYFACAGWHATLIERHTECSFGSCICTSWKFLSHVLTKHSSVLINLV